MSQFWRNALMMVMGITMLFGLSMIFLSQPIHELFMLIVYNGIETSSIFNEESLRYIKLLYGIMGAVMAAWMIPFIYLLRQGDKLPAPQVLGIILASLLFWYVFDTGWSAYLAYWGNVALNTGFLISFVIPLGFMVRNYLGKLSV